MDLLYRMWHRDTTGQIRRQLCIHPLHIIRKMAHSKALAVWWCLTFGSWYYPVNMQVSYRYRHLPGLYRTCRIPFANTGLVLFQYLHADTYNLQANVFWPGTFWIPAHQYIHTLPVNIFWPDTVLPSAYRYLLFTGKYLLARYHFAPNIPIPTLYQQISSGPVPFCP